jgi:bacterioferritin (cytochrome b1)
MKINELSKPLTANALNESLGKNFGQRLRLEAFTLSQLEDARNRLRTQLADVETNESFDTVHKSDAYQKGKLFLDTIVKEIDERDEWVTEAEKDPETGFTKWLKATHNKSVRELKGNEYTKMSKEYKASKKEAVKEGAEESAQLTMAAKDMVDRVTGWMEDTAEMQTESMLELGDSIRDELGSEMSEQFINTVKPALENLYSVFETTREALTGGVAIITGEGGPEVMPGDETGMEDPAMEPTVDGEPGAEGDMGVEEPVADEFGASEPATGGEEVADREKRESVNHRSRRLGNILSTESASKKKS